MFWGENENAVPGECLDTISSPNFYRNMERPVLAVSEVYVFLTEAPYLQNLFAMTIHMGILVLAFRSR